MSIPAPREPVTHRGGLARNILPALVLAALSILLFLPSLPYEFLNWDDEVYIHRNPWLLNLSFENAVGVFLHPYFSNYHPLTMLSLMVDFQWSGYDPVGYRLVNILLHGVTVAAAWGVFRALGIGRVVAFGFLLFFALHPLRIESVVWISERKDVLCALFYILALWCWVGGRGVLGVAGTAVLFLLALMSKAMAVSLPLVLLAHDLLLRRETVARRWPVYTAFVLLSGLFVFLNMRAQQDAISVDYIGWGERLSMAAWAPLHYSLKTVWPAGLSPLYPQEAAPFHRLPAAIAGFVYTVAMLVLAIVSVRRWPVLAFGLFGAAIVLGPVSGIVPFGAAYAADRYSYLPTLLLFIGIASVFPAPYRRQPAWLAAMLVPSVVMAALTLSLMPSWQSSSTLWERVLIVYPDSNKARFNAVHAARDTAPAEGIASEAGAMGAAIPALAVASELQVFTLIREGDFAAAEAAARAIRAPQDRQYWLLRLYIAMDDAAQESAAARELLLQENATTEQQSWAAWSLARRGHDAEARAALERIDTPTMLGGPAWGMLARDASASGDHATAESDARRALAIFPAEGNALRALVAALDATGASDDALRPLRRAVRHRATDTTILAWALVELARRTGDAMLLDRALAQEPSTDRPARERAATLAYIAWLAEDNARIPRAAELYEAALALDPENLEALQNYAILNLRAGRKDEGIQLLERAQAVAPNDEMIAENLRRARE